MSTTAPLGQNARPARVDSIGTATGLLDVYDGATLEGMLGSCTQCHVCAHGRFYRAGHGAPIRLRQPTAWMRSVFQAALEASGLEEPLFFAADGLGGRVALAVSNPRMIVVAEHELRAQVAKLWKRKARRATPYHDAQTIFTREVFDWIAAVAVVAHELGHLAAFDNGDYRTGPDAEADADHFAGRVLARMSLRVAPASLLFEAIGCRTLVCTHPRPWERQDAFHDGHAFELRVMEFELSTPWLAT